MNGTIKLISTERGYGFIQPDRGRDIFFHVTELANRTLDTIAVGEHVEFELSKDRSGRPAAVDVRVV